MREPVDAGATADAKASRTLAWRASAGSSVCDACRARRRRAWTTAGRDRRPGRRLIEAPPPVPPPVQRHRHDAVGSRRTARPARASVAPRPAAIDRRPSYFSACRIARSAPSYSPTVRPAAIGVCPLRHRGHRSSDAGLRHDPSGSPQTAQNGGAERPDCIPAVARRRPSRAGSRAAVAQAAHDGREHDGQHAVGYRAKLVRSACRAWALRDRRRSSTRPANGSQLGWPSASLGLESVRGNWGADVLTAATSRIADAATLTSAHRGVSPAMAAWSARPSGGVSLTSIRSASPHSRSSE